MVELGAGSQENYQQVFTLLRSGKIFACSEAELAQHLKSLCVYHAPNVGQDQTAAAILLQHLLLSSTILRISKSNQRMNILVVILAVIAILVGVVQVWAQLRHC